MLTLAKKKRLLFSEVTPNDVVGLLNSHFANLMSKFYEMESQFLSVRYKVHGSIETSHIILSLIRNVHLSIIRQREQNLDHDISLKNFTNNLNNIDIPSQKIVNMVNITGIPKETVRRKIRKLLDQEYIFNNKKDKEYYWSLNKNKKRSDFFIKIVQGDINMISKFAYEISKLLNLDLEEWEIRDEIQSQFSFHFYHFLSCQLSWMKMWQQRIKDIDLVLITLQALIPTLQYINKNENLNTDNIQNLHKIIGSANNNYLGCKYCISASSISEITGIPRATCIRKLLKLEKMGTLVREKKSKRYYVNQFVEDRTRFILTENNVRETTEIFSRYIAIMLNALIRNKNKKLKIKS